jgi:hypothetical protein
MGDATPPSRPQAGDPQAVPPQAAEPQAVLFACGLNAVRSPMAAALLRHMGGAPLYVASAGVRTAELDPFAVAAMAEIGIDIAAHRPITFEELEDLEGLNFDLIITLSPEAHHPSARRASGVLADRRPGRCRGQSGAADGCLSGRPRSAHGAHQGALPAGARRPRVKPTLPSFLVARRALPATRCHYAVVNATTFR